MIHVVVVIAVFAATLPVHNMPCWAVRKAVAQYGEAAVESWARVKRIPAMEIEKARRCLK